MEEECSFPMPDISRQKFQYQVWDNFLKAYGHGGLLMPISLISKPNSVFLNMSQAWVAKQ